MARLYELKNIKGVKDATGDLNRVTMQLNKMGKEFIQLTGEDDNTLEFNKRGGVGCISVTANVAAKLCADFHKASLLKDNETALLINQAHLHCTKHSLLKAIPSPVKYAASLLKLSPADVRLPLVQVTEKTKEVEKALKFAKLL